MGAGSAADNGQAAAIHDNATAMKTPGFIAHTRVWVLRLQNENGPFEAGFTPGTG